MSTLAISKTDLEKYVSIYGPFHEDEKQRACEIAEETVRKVIEVHAESIKSFQDLDEAGSYILSYVSDILEDEGGEIVVRINLYAEELFGQKDASNFSTAIEWGAINCLKDLLKQHRI